MKKSQPSRKAAKLTSAAPTVSADVLDPLDDSVEQSLNFRDRAFGIRIHGKPAADLRQDIGYVVRSAHALTRFLRDALEDDSGAPLPPTRADTEATYALDGIEMLLSLAIALDNQALEQETRP